MGGKLPLVGIDLAGKPERPSGWALLRGRTVTVKELYADDEILFETLGAKPSLIAIDAPLTLPERGALRQADREMQRRGYPVLPPLFPAMRELTLRAISLTEALRREQVRVIEVHPASGRKALQMPPKDWRRIQEIFVEMGLGGDWEKRPLSPHESDAIIAVITVHLHVRGKTEDFGEQKEGFIIVPLPMHWSKSVATFACNNRLRSFPSKIISTVKGFFFL